MFVLRTVYKWLSPSFLFYASYTLLSKCSLSHAEWGANWPKPTGTDQLSKRPACLSSIMFRDTALPFLSTGLRSVLIWTSLHLTQSDCQASLLPGHQTPAQSRPLVTMTTVQCTMWLRRKCHRAASLLGAAANEVCCGHWRETALHAEVELKGEWMEHFTPNVPKEKALEMVIRKNVSISVIAWLNLTKPVKNMDGSYFSLKSKENKAWCSSVILN